MRLVLWLDTNMYELEVRMVNLFISKQYDNRKSFNVFFLNRKPLLIGTFCTFSELEIFLWGQIGFLWGQLLILVAKDAGNLLPQFISFHSFGDKALAMRKAIMNTGPSP